jgi:hypothetical protein
MRLRAYRVELDGPFGGGVDFDEGVDIPLGRYSAIRTQLRLGRAWFAEGLYQRGVVAIPI